MINKEGVSHMEDVLEDGPMRREVVTQMGK